MHALKSKANQPKTTDLSLLKMRLRSYLPLLLLFLQHPLVAQETYRTSNTVTEYPGQWTKIATVEINNRYWYSSSILELNGGNRGKYSGTAKLFFRVKQQAPFPEAPYIQLELLESNNGLLLKENFMAVHISSSGSDRVGSTIVELYVRIFSTHEIISFVPTHKFELAPAVFHGGQPFLADLPSGTQYPCLLVDKHGRRGLFEGRVGIGTDSPAKSLEIKAGDQDGIRITSEGIPRLELDGWNEGELKSNWVLYSRPSNGEFGIWDDNQKRGRLKIDSLGDVSIDGHLKIDGNNHSLRVGHSVHGWDDQDLIGAEYGVWEDRTNAAGTYFYRWTGTPGRYHNAYIGQQKGGGHSWGLAFNTDILDDTDPSTTTRMFINTKGNVGIGTTNPVERLHVEGTAQLNHSGFNAIQMRYSDINGGAQSIGSNENGDLILSAHNTVAGNEHLLVQQNTGNVGIGTTTPKSKLTVGGDILANQVRVVTNVNSVPDYVFGKEYKLLSLEEVEAYVKENSHLPEVPSAEEIAEDGHDLGAMNLLLLKKIEELTLYVIEQQKEINEIRAELKAVKKSEP